MGRGSLNRRDWRNGFGFEQQFRERLMLRGLALMGVFVLVSSVGFALVYQQVIAPLAAPGLMPGDARLPGLGRLLAGWVTVIGGLCSLVTIAVGLHFGHKAGGPIYRMKAELENLEQGRPTRPVLLRRGDEFGELAAVVNRLLERRPEWDHGARAEFDLDRMRAAHRELLEKLELVDADAVSEADRQRLEACRALARELVPKLEQ